MVGNCLSGAALWLEGARSATRAWWAITYLVGRRPRLHLPIDMPGIVVLSDLDWDATSAGSQRFSRAARISASGDTSAGEDDDTRRAGNRFDRCHDWSQLCRSVGSRANCRPGAITRKENNREPARPNPGHRRYLLQVRESARNEGVVRSTSRPRG